MYAQLVRSRTSPETRMEMHQTVDELIPALCDEPGFAGALSLVDHGSGMAIMIVLWQSADQARRPFGDRLSVLAPLLRAAGSPTGTDGAVTVWEVTVHV